MMDPKMRWEGKTSSCSAHSADNLMGLMTFFEKKFKILDHFWPPRKNFGGFVAEIYPWHKQGRRSSSFRHFVILGLKPHLPPPTSTKSNTSLLYPSLEGRRAALWIPKACWRQYAQ